MEKKTLTKKIIITVLLALLVVLAILFFIHYFPNFMYFNETIEQYKDVFSESAAVVISQYKKDVFILLCLFIFLIINAIIDIVLIFNCWGGFINIIKVKNISIEEYKENKRLAKIEKIKKEQEKLQKKMKGLEK